MNISKNILENIDQNSLKLSKQDILTAIDSVLKITDSNMSVFRNQFPSPSSSNLKYSVTDNRGWTPSFWTGILWLAYYHTGISKYKHAAMANVESFKQRLEKKYDFDTHDIGFLYFLSCVSAYKLTHSQQSKNTAIAAADELIKRYKEKGEFIQAWGSVDDESAYRLIIDCMMNLPLLYWASQITSDKKYYNIAYSHAKTSMDFIIRSDSSTFHTFYFDPKTGKKVKGVTAQGYNDSSCWARGQAWAIYGTALSFRYTNDKKFLEYNSRVTQYFINHLPEDLVSYWDLIFTSGTEERDSSAAAIAVCGLIEASKFMDSKTKDLYLKTAKAILYSLIKNYAAKAQPEAMPEGLILHSVYSKPASSGVDEFCIWGDYYYFEALLRSLKEFE